MPSRLVECDHESQWHADPNDLAAVAGADAVEIIDQTALPHAIASCGCSSLDDVAHAIRSMQVRGAPLIGVTAAYGVALALGAAGRRRHAAGRLRNAGRDTADRGQPALGAGAHAGRAAPLPPRRAPMRRGSRPGGLPTRTSTSVAGSAHGLQRCARVGGQRGRLEIMTHCNAGWLATVDHGTALAPVYAAFDAGIDGHVWVSETRPRNQGLLTAWELRQHGVPHTLIADNAAGLLLARGTIDAVIVGADRIAANGDVANKVGTYLKALAARAAGVPFYVAAPRSTIDFACPNGAAIPIEERAADELRLSARSRCGRPGGAFAAAAGRRSRRQPGLRRHAGELVSA
jgi:methylthioribose-1-phosphate isomerase